MIEYRIFTHSTGEPIDTVDMHVLARAYRIAYRSIFAREPLGPHLLRALNVQIVFTEIGRDRRRKTG